MNYCNATNLTRCYWLRFFASLMLMILALTVDAQPWIPKRGAGNRMMFEDIRRSAEGYFAGRGRDRGTGYKPFKRWEQYWSMHTYPDGSLPPANVRQTAWQTYLNQHPNIPVVPPGGSNWSSLGPNSSAGGYAGIGRINRVAYHPSDANTIYVCTAGGGLWKSTTGGGNWINLTPNLVRLGTSDLLIDSNDPNTLYLATGDCDAGDTPSIGILKSTDGGANWSTTGLSFSDNQYVDIYKIVQHSTNSNILLAATSRGIYRSTNAGQNWSLVLSNITIFDLEKKTNSSTTFFATGNDGQGRILISTDDGSTWTVRSTLTGVYRSALAVSPANANYVGVIAAKSTDHSFQGYYASTDGGLNYTLRSSSPNLLGWDVNGNDNGGQGWYDLCIAISPTNADQIIIGGINTWKSNNGGVTWTLGSNWYNYSTYPTIHADHHDISYQSSSTMFIACDGGIYKSTNAGVSWSDISNGLTISQIYRIGVSQQDTKTIAGLQDNGTKLRGTTGTWVDEIGGDGMDCAIDPSNSNIMYGELQNGGLRRTTNNGSTWTDISPNGPGAWISPFLIDPTTPSTVYFGTARTLYKSTDRGTNWTAIGTGLTNGYDVDYIAVAPANSSHIYIVSGYYWDKRISKTTNGGASWASVAPPINDRISSIIIHPTDVNTIYITYASYSSGNKVFRSNNGGTTWTNISGTLPNLPVNCIVYQNGSNGGLYLGNDVGVFYRDNSLSDWVLFNGNLPNAEVFDLEINYTTNKIQAATYGRGLWESPLYSAQASSLVVSPSTASVGAAAGNLSLSLSANVAWTLTSNAAWLSATPSSGAADATLNAAYAANTGAARTGVLTITGAGLTQTVTVTQAAGQSLSVSPTSQTLSSSAGSLNLSVSANVSWTVVSNATWLSVNTSSGNGNATVVASFTSNTGALRTGVLTFSGGGLTQTVTLTQNAVPNLSISPSTTQNVGNQAGSLNLSVTSNVSWTASSSATWLSVNPLTGINNGTIAVSYTANPNASSRSATLTISGGGITRTLSVTQAAGTLTISPSSTQNVPYSAGSFNVSVTSSLTWTLSSNASWLTGSVSTGNGNGTVLISYAANPNGTARTGTLTFTGGGITRTLTVSQALAPSLTVSPTSQTLAAAESSVSISVNANIAWTVSSNVSWLTTNISSGTGNNIVGVTCFENIGSVRTGILTFTGGGLTQTVSITQNAPPFITISPSTTQTVNATAGTLTVNLSSNINWSVSTSVTWLSVSPNSGNSDAAIAVNYTQNTGTGSRSGVVTFTGGGITRTLSISQSAPARLTVTPTIRTATTAAASFSITISSNVAWSVSSNASWLTVSPTSGSGNRTLSAGYTANTGAARTGILTFTGGGITQTVTVNQAGAPYLNVSATTQTVTAAAGSFPFSIASNQSWSISSNVTWLSVSPSTGSNDGTITANYTANAGTARTGILTVTGGGFTRTLTVTQNAPAALSVTPLNQAVTASSGSLSITVSSNLAWTVSSNASWLTPATTSGSNNGTLSVAYAANTSGQRIGLLTFSGGGLTQTVTITQASGIVGSLTVSPAAVTIGAATDTVLRIQVQANVAWTVSSNQSWIIPHVEAGANNATVEVNYQTNPNAVSRSSILTFTGSGITRTVNITQVAASTGSSLVITPDLINAAAPASSVSVQINTAGCWDVVENSPWLMAKTLEGQGSGTLTLFLQQNTGGSRSAQLIINTAGTSQTITINQAGAGNAQLPSLDGLRAASSTDWAPAQSKQTDLQLFPNPAQDLVHVEIQTGREVVPGTLLLILDAWGRTVQQHNCTQTRETIDLSRFANGMYSFVLRLPNAKYITKKLIVSH